MAKRRRVLWVTIMAVLFIIGAATFIHLRRVTSYADPDKTSSGMTITSDSVGPITLGMTTEEMIRVIGPPDIEHGGTCKYFGLGLEVFITMDRVHNAFAHAYVPPAERRGSNNYEAFQGATDKGIKIGSSKSSVENSYGKPDQRTINMGEEQLIFNNPPMTFAFNRDGNVRSIMVRSK